MHLNKPYRIVKIYVCNTLDTTDSIPLFRSKADESYQLKENKGPVDAYLDIKGIIEIAKKANVDAIHPGYGFLSENPDFVEACEEAGIVFIGPSKDIMNAMGDKISSKQMAIKAGVPIIPGYAESFQRRRRTWYAYRQQC